MDCDMNQQLIFCNVYMYSEVKQQRTVTSDSVIGKKTNTVKSGC